MHELSIAQNILEIVQQNVPPTQHGTIRSVTVKVGELAGVVPDSLHFCFGAITNESALKDVKLIVERIPFTLFCRTCQRTSSGEGGIVLCPACGSTETSILSGIELCVSSIELDDELVEAQ